MAEREGFEPSIPVKVYRISSPARSTTLPPLQRAKMLIFSDVSVKVVIPFVHMKHSMKEMGHSMWKRLAVMTGASFASMYVLMYMMVDRFENVLPNINQIYMAGMMTAAMVVIELVVMNAMYPDKKTSAWVIAGSLVTLALFIGGTRTQFAVTDEEFLRSMIPHHAAAILMCEKTDLRDPEIQELCDSIIASQSAEIDFMKSKLNEPAQ